MALVFLEWRTCGLQRETILQSNRLIPAVFYSVLGEKLEISLLCTTLFHGLLWIVFKSFIMIHLSPHWMWRSIQELNWLINTTMNHVSFHLGENWWWRSRSIGRSIKSQFNSNNNKCSSESLSLRDFCASFNENNIGDSGALLLAQALRVNSTLTQIGLEIQVVSFILYCYEFPCFRE